MVKRVSSKPQKGRDTGSPKGQKKATEKKASGIRRLA